MFDVSGISATNAAARVSWGRDADENCKVIAAMTRAHHHDDDARYDRWKGWHNLSIVYLNEETPHPRDYSMSTIVSCGFATLLVVFLGNGIVRLVAHSGCLKMKLYGWGIGFLK